MLAGHRVLHREEDRARDEEHVVLESAACSVNVTVVKKKSVPKFLSTYSLKCESRGDQCAPHKSRQGGCNAHATLSTGEPGNRALRRSIASTSSPFLRRDASERTGSITGQWIVICPCFTPARCLREGETAAVLLM
ncbi:hypothetical protein EYF80_032143 [Liparis tanakae]|uniref:Uncharacterized protein n=1 Tax=Liparis tanakae TaxID=230148 RepID=A0A4Z2GWL9_9TELE|nr:hypothetical protein EYF80_032143 [Liparis tanakae]